MDRQPNGQFAKGHKGFKPKGSRNRFTVAMMEELMRGDYGELDFHPMLEAKRLYRETSEDKIKVALLKEMLSFGNDRQYVEIEVTEPPADNREDMERELYEALKSVYHKKP